MKIVESFVDLQSAIRANEKDIVVRNSIACYHSVILPEGGTLRGEDSAVAMLLFTSGDGIGLSGGNTVKNLCIQTTPANKAIYLASAADNIGSLVFENLTLTGQFSIVARKNVMSGDIKAKNIDVVSCDARPNLEMPQKYGVNVVQGAFTIYHMSDNPSSVLNVSAENVSVGRKGAPVIGSGVFVGAQTGSGGKVNISKLSSGNVYSNGMIPFGTADMITAGFFIVDGAYAKSVINDGETITYGVNDMVLDLWGQVDTWVVNFPVTSYGPSGIGFVNFGTVKKFTVHAPVTTYGLGARGYNQYDGTAEDISFHSIATYGNGSIGVQLSKPIGKLTVLGDITTHGSVGNSLVKGINMQLPAIALSVKEGGEAQVIDIKGNLITRGNDVVTYQVSGGVVHAISVGGEVVATGKNAKPISVENGGKSNTDELKLKS